MYPGQDEKKYTFYLDYVMIISSCNLSNLSFAKTSFAKFTINDCIVKIHSGKLAVFESANHKNFTRENFCP